MQKICPEISYAIELLEKSGNRVLEKNEGWSQVKLDIVMSKPLNEETKAKLISCDSNLKYWEYMGSPHNNAGNGFICEIHKISISFPL